MKSYKNSSLCYERDHFSMNQQQQCPMCEGVFNWRYNLLRHVRDLHGGVWVCKGCEKAFTRGDNFKYHTRTCAFITSGTKREGVALPQQGWGRVSNKILPPSLPVVDDPAEISVEFTNGNIVAGVAEMTQLVSEQQPIAKFYLSLHAKYGSKVTTIAMITNPGNDMEDHFNQLQDQMEVNEKRGWLLEKLLRLNLHIPIEDSGQALNDTLQDFSINLGEKQQTVDNIYEVLSSSIYRFKNTILDKPLIKIYMTLYANFHQSTDPSFMTDPSVVLNTEPEEILAATDINKVLDTFYSFLVDSIDAYELQGSGWVLDQLLRLDLHVLKYDPLRASTYLPLPREIQLKRAVINIKNSDNLCFLWCVIAGIYGDTSVPHMECVSHYKPYQCKIKMDGLEMPMALKHIPKFECMNNISISVYGFEVANKKYATSEEEEKEEDEKEEGFVYPIRIACKVAEKHVNLLLISSGEASHYCLIRNFSRLVRSQVTKRKTAHHFCRFCLHGFVREDLLSAHEGECFVHGGQKTVFPEKTIVEFSSIEKQLKAPFVVYADFESVLENVDIVTGKTAKFQRHSACSYMYHIVPTFPNLISSSSSFNATRLYVGKDAAEHFLDSLQRDLYQIIQPIIENEVEMIFDDAAAHNFASATHCHICKEPLLDDTVRDHCHFTGAFRGAAHQNCNLKYAVNAKRYKLPVYFHNLRGYDAHLIMQAVRSKHTRIDIIPNNFERYISFTVGRLKFLDSMQFLSCSLAGLAKNMKDEDFANLRCAFPQNYELLSRKGVYPYDYMNTFERFKETRLPSKDDFYSRLNEEGIGEEDYAHAQRVWHTFHCVTMRDYHDLYLKADVLLLADIFEKFRTMSLCSYGLDPAHYYSLPGLSWDAALKYSGVKLDLIVDIDMYQLVERGLRGGVSMISHRYAEASPSRSLIYLDANSLYSWAMCQPLPVSDFQ
jgi:hypothetical protein